MREINEIIVHCTDTPYNTTVESIRNYHMNVLGWRDIGYHYLVTYDGIAVAGRPTSMVGSHCKGHNANSIGVAYIGKQPTLSQLSTIRELVNRLGIAYGITKVTPHCAYNKNKTCPNMTQEALRYIRGDELELTEGDDYINIF